MVEYTKLEHQINLSGNHKGKFDDCPECKRKHDEIKEKKIFAEKEKLDKRIKSNLKSILKRLDDMETLGMKFSVEDEKYRNPMEVKKIIEDMLETGNYSDFSAIEKIFQL